MEDEILTVRYEDGRWSKPYYDCGGGNIWMLTYTVPFFGYANDTYYFKWVSASIFKAEGQIFFFFIFMSSSKFVVTEELVVSILISVE